MFLRLIIPLKGSSLKDNFKLPHIETNPILNSQICYVLCIFYQCREANMQFPWVSHNRNKRWFTVHIQTLLYPSFNLHSKPITTNASSAANLSVAACLYCVCVGMSLPILPGSYRVTLKMQFWLFPSKQMSHSIFSDFCLVGAAAIKMYEDSSKWVWERIFPRGPLLALIAIACYTLYGNHWIQSVRAFGCVGLRKPSNRICSVASWSAPHLIGRQFRATFTHSLKAWRLICCVCCI